jgi:hypothetical protein
MQWRCSAAGLVQLVMGKFFEREQATHGTCGGSERWVGSVFDRGEARHDAHLFSLCDDGWAIRGDRLQD